jgi:hypothetical protein
MDAPRIIGPTPDEIQEVADALRGLRFGVVQVVVQDGVVVQIERTEKRRLRLKKPAE